MLGYRFRVRAVAALAIGLSACGGGGGDEGGSPPIVHAVVSPGGIWNGTDQATGLPIVGLVAEPGEFHFIRSDGTQFFGNLNVSGGGVSANFTGAAPAGFVFADGSTTGTGSLSGTIQSRISLNGTSNFTTSRGNATTSNISLTFNPVYNRASSLTTIAGNYRDTSTNAVVNVNSNGVVFSQDASTGCVINGTVATINAAYNAYRVEYSFSGCRPPYGLLNGTTARGLATLDNTETPERVIIGVVNGSAGYSLAGSFPRT